MELPTKFFGGGSKNSQQNNSETVTNENDKDILKEIYIYIFRKNDRKLLII